jgi:acetyl esterase/lipase
MGSGIAQVSAVAGHDVVLRDVTDEALARGRAAIEKSLSRFVAKGTLEQDAAEAARWTMEHAAEFGGDPHRVFLAGHSAGAHIAALLASDARYLAAQGLTPRDFAGAIGVAGPYDFLPLLDPALIDVFGAEADWPASQPIRFVDGDEPPFLLLQGGGDRIVEPRNAAAMADALRTHGVPMTYTAYPRVGHFRILAGIRYPWLAPTLADVLAFITRTPPAR